MIAWLHAIGLPALAYLNERSSTLALLAGGPIAVLAAVGSVRQLSQRLRTLAVTTALLISTAVVILVAASVPEAHLHLFAIVPVIALYQDATAFALTLAYVAIHRVLGIVFPALPFNEALGQVDPWIWTVVQAIFVGGVGLVSFAAWRMNEAVLVRQRSTERDLTDEKRVAETLNAIGTGIVSELDLGRVAQLVTDEAVAAVGAAFGAFFYNTYAESGESYMLYTVSGAPESAFSSFPMPRNTQVFAETFSGAGVVRSDDITDDPRYGQNSPYYGIPPDHLPLKSYLAVPVRSRGSSEVLGGLFFGHPDAGVFTDRSERIAVGIATQAAIAFDNAHLYQAEREAHREAEDARGRLSLLDEAGRLLVASLDPMMTLRNVAQITVPTFADLCVIDLVEHPGELRRVDVFAAPGFEDLAPELKSFAPDPANDAHPVARVINGGGAELINFQTPGLVDSATRTASHADVVRRMHGTSAIVVPLVGRTSVLGAVTFITLEASDRVLGGEDLPLAEEIGRRAGLAVENARLYQAERDARVEATRASSNLALLAEAGKLTATPLDEEVRVRLIAEVTVPTLADICLVDTLDPTGTIRRMTAAADGLGDIAQRLASFPPDPNDESHPVVRVMKDGNPIVVEQIDDGFLGEVTRSPEHRDAASAAAAGSTIIVPLAARGGNYGSLTLINVAGSGHRFSTDDLPLVEEIGRRAGIAVHNARLYQAERVALSAAEKASERLTLLAEASRLLAASLDVESSLQSVAELTVPTLADLCLVDILDEDGALIRVAATGAPGLEGLAERIKGTPAPEEVTSIHPIRRVLNGDGSQLVEQIGPDELDRVAETGKWREITARIEVLSSLSVPLSSRERILGALTLVTTKASGRHLSKQDVTLAEDIGRRAGNAIENARLYSQQRSVAESLQHALLPEHLPSIPGFEAAARYLPGAPGERVGGDWYDLFEIPTGELAIVMGDVVGHGIGAASSMAQLRSALRAYIWDRQSPAEALSRLNTLLYGLEREGMATVMVAILDPITTKLRLANAGHPPLLLARSDEEPEFIGEGLGPPLGAVPFARFQERVIELRANDMLVVYTDGLVEDRGTTLDSGLGRLRDAVSEGGTDVEALSDHILEACLGERYVDDDVAVLILRALSIGDRLSLRMPAEPRMLARFRQTLRRWLHEHDIEDPIALDVLVACGEACNNAIEHGKAMRDGTFEVEAAITGQGADLGLEVLVRNQGSWRERRDDGGGRGLPVMEGLMDSVTVEEKEGGIEVRMRHRLTVDSAGAGAGAQQTGATS
jgi:GAF domain-containing protein/anti-sigma regulatory factor (Ser/Thr protein kinase)